MNTLKKILKVKFLFIFTFLLSFFIISNFNFDKLLQQYVYNQFNISYDFSYSSSNDITKSITIENIKYKNKQLLNKIVISDFDWDFFDNEIQLKNLEIEQLNYDTFSSLYKDNLKKVVNTNNKEGFENLIYFLLDNYVFEVNNLVIKEEAKYLDGKYSHRFEDIMILVKDNKLKLLKDLNSSGNLEVNNLDLTTLLFIDKDNNFNFSLLHDNYSTILKGNLTSHVDIQIKTDNLKKILKKDIDFKILNKNVVEGNLEVNGYLDLTDLSNNFNFNLNTNSGIIDSFYANITDIDFKNNSFKLNKFLFKFLSNSIIFENKFIENFNDFKIVDTTKKVSFVQSNWDFISLAIDNLKLNIPDLKFEPYVDFVFNMNNNNIFITSKIKNTILQIDDFQEQKIKTFFQKQDSIFSDYIQLPSESFEKLTSLNTKNTDIKFILENIKLQKKDVFFISLDGDFHALNGEGNGKLNLEGTYKLGKTNLKLKPSTMVFDTKNFLNPSLELSLENFNEKLDINTFIKISGKYQNPFINIYSTPFMKKEEIVALLFGEEDLMNFLKSVNNIEDDIESTGDNYNIKGISFISNTIAKKLFGNFNIEFDKFNISERNDTSGFNINVQKRISNDVIVEYSVQDEEQNTNLKYKLSPNTFIEFENTNSENENSNSFYFTFEH